MQEPLISVIVPIYKVASYLEKCIESIVMQTYKNLEIILIEDGSPDNCGSICDIWAKRDSRIKVIHKENGGAGMARNIGVKNAHGELFAFVDGDDYLSEYMFEMLVEKMDVDVDIVECEMLYTVDDNAFMKWDKMFSAKVFNTTEALKEHINDRYFKQTPCNKLYRQTVVDGVFFPVGKKIDDEFWTYIVLGKARKLIHIDAPLYAYRQHEGSVMHSILSLNRLQAIEAKVERHKYIIEKYPSLKNISLVNLWFCCIYQRQLSMREMTLLDEKRAKTYIEKVINDYPVFGEENLEITFKQKMWLRMATVSLDLTCKIRNYLRIGL